MIEVRDADESEHSPLHPGQLCLLVPLSWALTAFWRQPIEYEDWRHPLALALEPDGIRLVGHRFATPATSQFLVTTKPDVPPLRIVQRVKGRLQHVVREQFPKALRRHSAIRSVGKVKRDIVQTYVASQLEHHPMANERVRQRFEQYQQSNPTINLGLKRYTSHGVFWHNLHIVLVHWERWRVIEDSRLSAVSEMIAGVSRARGYFLQEAGILPDHVHLLLGCGFGDSPRDVALSFFNNLAFAQGMQPVYQCGGFIGTVGEYDFGGLRAQSLLDPDQQDRGDAGGSAGLD